MRLNNANIDTGIAFLKAESATVRIPISESRKRIPRLQLWGGGKVHRSLFGGSLPAYHMHDPVQPHGIFARTESDSLR